MSEIDPPRESELDPPREKVSLFELAWTFNHIALASFGGGCPRGRAKCWSSRNSGWAKRSSSPR
jgi:hypothetical protein